MTPQEMLEALGGGMTQAEIAKRVGKSRDAVAGAIDRYRKANGITPNCHRHKGESVPDVVTYTGADARGFLEVLERNGCRYIAGDIRDGTAAYCSGANEGKGYCKEHYAMCYMGIKRKVRGYV